MKKFTIRMCGEPECVFCRRTVDEVRDILDKTLIRPIVDGESYDLLSPENEDGPDPCDNVESCLLESTKGHGW